MEKSERELKAALEYSDQMEKLESTKLLAISAAPKRPDWIQPLVGASPDPDSLGGTVRENVGERDDRRGLRWWFQQGAK